jgi:hypothetical protein
MLDPSKLQEHVDLRLVPREQDGERSNFPRVSRLPFNRSKRVEKLRLLLERLVDQPQRDSLLIEQCNVERVRREKVR